MRKAKLGDVCEFRPSKRLARIGLAENDPVSFVPMNDLGIHQKYLTANDERPLSNVADSYTYFAEGDVLLAKITPCFENGKLGIARGLTNGIGFGSSEFTVIRPGPETLADYVYYFLEQDEVRERGAKVMTGAVGHKRVPQEFVEALQIPLPPLQEQRRIATVLDQAFAAIATATANAETNLANARKLFELSLRDILAGCGEGTTLGEATDIKVGFAFKSSGYSSNESDIPLIRGDNIVQGRLRWEDLKRWPRSAAHEYEAYLLESGDVLLAMDRTWVKSGLKYAIVGPDDVPSLLLQRVARLRAKDITCSEFIALQIAAPAFTEYVLGIQTGLGVPHISGKQIAEYRFQLPPRARQLELIETLGAVKRASDRLANGYAAKLAALKSLRQSLLQCAFSGELKDRVQLAA